MSYLLKRAISMLVEHPWIRTESDVKCALYTHLFTLLSIRIADLRESNWRIATEYMLMPECFVDIAILTNETPLFLIELKHLKGVSQSYIRKVSDDFDKHHDYLKSEGQHAHLLQVVTSAFNGQHKELVETQLLAIYETAQLSSPGIGKPGARITYVQVLK